MGTFIDTYGTPSIPKDKLPEFRARTLAIAEQGGMMTLSHITMFGRHLTLLKPVEAGKYACIDFYYNYFEEECWENAGFSSETQCLYSNKIGRRIFNRVMRALYILQELYSEAPCFPHIDGQLFDATDELGWLNYLFNANFANNRVPALNRDTFHLESEGKPVPPIGTAAFLQVADDERAYWWRVDVQFSPEMESWLALLRQEYQKITAYPGPAPANYPEILVATLERAEMECGTHFFADAFEEFMGHSSFRDVQVAILLASRLIDGYAPGGEFLARDGWKWDVPRHNDDFGAYAIKLYFAVLGNPELRQKVFGF